MQDDHLLDDQVPQYGRVAKAFDETEGMNMTLALCIGMLDIVIKDSDAPFKTSLWNQPL